MKLDIFDLDGTLWRNPLDTPENRQFYEEQTSIPWVVDKTLAKKLGIGTRSGWYGRPESLEPPLVPYPVPKELLIEETKNKFFQSKEDPNTITFILTGRHGGQRKQIYRILHDLELVKMKETNNRLELDDKKVQVYLLGDDPLKSNEKKPHKTLDWKLWCIHQFINKYKADSIEIWEDRIEHVSEFYEIKKTINNVKVNHVYT